MEEVEVVLHRGRALGPEVWGRKVARLPDEAAALLRVATLDGEPSAFVFFGHDVVPEGYEITEPGQICVSTGDRTDGDS